MHYQYIPYIWLLVGSAFASLFLGIYAFAKRRSAKGAASFILSMAVLTLWSSANALEMSAVDFPTKLFWANMQYIAYCYSPVTLLALCMEFTGYDRLIRSRKVLWFAFIPTIIIILVWTDSLHGLIRYDLHMDYSGSFPVITKKYGLAFFIHAAYSQFLNIFAWVLLIRAVFYKNTVYRRQALSLFIGLSMIVILNISYISGLSPIKRFDVTPITFGPAGLIAAWGIFRFKLFDVIPVARATVIETMDAGVMVLDLQERILDINPAFQKVIGYTASKAATMQAKEVCRKVPELVRACEDRNISHSEFSIDENGMPQYYEVFFSPLNDNKGVLIGRLAVIYEITEKKLAQQRYLKQQWELAVIEERERLARDMHDNLGQVLGFINLQAQGIRQELSRSGVEIVSDRLDRLISVSQTAHEEVREYIRSMRHAETMEKDFVTAMTKDIEGFEERTGIQVKMDIPRDFAWEDIKPNIRINILNIVKEAFNNIGKHSDARSAGISLKLLQGNLQLTVEDDGKGFDIGSQGSSIRSKFGLNIMRERASEIGASIEISSTVGKGSKIVLSVPIVEEGKQ